MARKKKQEDAPAGSPAWMATFSDLMNLLLCFFVLLFSMSSVDAEKYAELVQSFNSSFSIFSAKQGQVIEASNLFPTNVNQIEDLEKYEKDTGKKEETLTPEEMTEESAIELIEELNKQKTEELYEDVSKMAEENSIENTIEVSIDSKYQYVKISINGAILFDSGKSDVKPEAERVLSRIGDILKNYDKNLIKIEGHTDNVPTTGGKYADNMMLSSDRAYNVWKYMVTAKLLDPSTLEASGRSEYEPIADNQTAEGRAKNRRVEFKIYTE